MSTGNALYLAMVIGAFTTFAVVVAWASANYTRWRDGKVDSRAHDTRSFGAAAPQMAE